MKTLKNIIGLGIFLLFIVLFTSCKEDSATSLDLSSDVNILSFKVGNTAGVVDNEKGTISVLVPAGTDLSAVKPSIALPENATVAPASGSAQNFTFSSTTPLVYRVYNGNVFNTYQVTVKEIIAEITAFRIGNKVGVINQENKSIIIYLPVGTAVKELNPSVEFTNGASIAPGQGGYVDFSSAVKYTLTYMEQTFPYTVTVVLGDEPA